MSTLPCLCGQRRLHHIAMFRSNVPSFVLLEGICEKIFVKKVTTTKECQRECQKVYFDLKASPWRSFHFVCWEINSKENLPKVLIYLISTLLFLSCFGLLPLDQHNHHCRTRPSIYVTTNMATNTHTHTQFVDNKSQIYHSLSWFTSQPWPYQHFNWSQHANITAVLWGQHDEHKVCCEYIASDMEWK